MKPTFRSVLLLFVSGGEGEQGWSCDSSRVAINHRIAQIEITKINSQNGNSLILKHFLFCLFFMKRFCARMRWLLFSQLYRNRWISQNRNGNTFSRITRRRKQEVVFFVVCCLLFGGRGREERAMSSSQHHTAHKKLCLILTC